MKYHFTPLFVVLLLLTSLFLTTTASGQLIQSDEIDEFSGNRVVIGETVDIDITSISGQSTIGFSYAAETLILVFHNNSRDSWQFLGHNEIQFIVDDDRWSLDFDRASSESLRRGTYEMNVVLLTESQARQLQNAEDVRFRFGGRHQGIIPQHIKDTIGEILARLE